MKQVTYCFDEILYYEFVDNELTATDYYKIKEHLQTCTRCREFVREIEKENEGIKSIFGPQAETGWEHRERSKQGQTTGESYPLPDLRDTVLAALDSPGQYSGRNAKRLLAYAASLALVLFSVVYLVWFSGYRTDKGSTGSGPLEPATTAAAKEPAILVQSASVEGQTAELHIFEDKDQDVKYIWLEKI